MLAVFTALPSAAKTAPRPIRNYPGGHPRGQNNLTPVYYSVALKPYLDD